MKQALHIFRKDVRRLWPQIAALMTAIAYFAALDIRFSALGPGSFGNVIIELIVGAAVWFLIARAVHEESLSGENQFWLTRPYERGSLFVAKVMMAVCVVIAPLFVADCLILAVQSLPLAVNLGGLLLKQIVTAAWLILPPLAIASVTRTITEDIMVWLVALAIAGLGYFPEPSLLSDFRSLNEKYLISLTILLLPVALWRQYSKRAAKTGRAIIAVAVLLPTLPFPEPAALAIDGLRNDPATSAVTLTATTQSVEVQPTLATSPISCASIPVSVTGVRPNWRLGVLSEKATFESGGRTWSLGWQRGGGGRSWVSYGSAMSGQIEACPFAADLPTPYAGNPIALHVSVALSINAEDPPIRVRSSRARLDVPGVGVCQFRYYFGGDKYVLACIAPVWSPRTGQITIENEESWSSAISNGQYPWTPMNLLPGMSPAYKWVTLPLDSQIRDAIAHGGELEFRPETQIAVLRREVTVKEVRFTGLQ